MSDTIIIFAGIFFGCLLFMAVIIFILWDLNR